MIYKCPWCGKGKKNIKSLKEHIHSQHYWLDHKARWIDGTNGF